MALYFSFPSDENLKRLLVNKISASDLVCQLAQRIFQSTLELSQNEKFSSRKRNGCIRTNKIKKCTQSAKDLSEQDKWSLFNVDY